MKQLPAFIDTHCHVHDSEFAEKFPDGIEAVLQRGRDSGVVQFMCVGTDLSSSEQAVALASKRPDCFASVALHPHEAADATIDQLKTEMKQLESLLKTDAKAEHPVIKAIGECGLDYFYHEDAATIERQQFIMRAHVELAVAYSLPIIFHIRDAFDDALRILAEYPKIQGVIHSFSAGLTELESVIDYGLYVGLNGIMTFTKDENQLAAAKAAPLEKIVLETDAPFLTPAPFRGKMCEPKHVVRTAEFLSELRGEDLSLLAQETTKNAQTLFRI